jgi:hypothetical protein
MPAGQVDPHLIGSIDQAPTVRFTTSQIETMLDLFFINGLALDAATNQLVMWFRKLAPGGTIDVTATGAIKCTTFLGLLTVESITCNVNQVATGEFAAQLLTTDGAAIPISFEEATYSPTSPAEKYFTLGKFYLDDAETSRVQAFRLMMNNNVQVQRSGGTIWPVHASIIQRQPRMEWDTHDLSVLDITPLAAGDVKIDGGIIGAAPLETVAFLQQILKGGGLEPAVDTKHIEFKMTEGMISVGNTIDGRPQEANPITVSVQGSYDGTADIITYAKGQTIQVAV